MGNLTSPGPAAHKDFPRSGLGFPGVPEFETGGRRTAGKVVVVTGEARGQGAAEVAVLAAEGALMIADPTCMTRRPRGPLPPTAA